MGSLTALMLARNKRFEVHLYEARAQYTRKQILLLNQHTQAILPREVMARITARGCWTDPPPKNTHAACITARSADAPLLAVSIQELERALWSAASKVVHKTHRPKRGVPSEARKTDHL